MYLQKKSSVFAEEIQFLQNVFTYKLLESCDKTEEHFKVQNILFSLLESWYFHKVSWIFLQWNKVAYLCIHYSLILERSITES